MLVIPLAPQNGVAVCVAVTEGVRQEQTDILITVLELTELEFNMPDFALEPEGLWSKFSEITIGKDIDFPDQKGFSGKYYLRAVDEQAVRAFFTHPLMAFLENQIGRAHV